MLHMALYKLDYLKNWLAREEGQDLIEYALIAVLISLAVITLLGGVGDQLNVVWQAVIDALGTA